MTVPFMRAYALLLLKTCHRRGAPAIGGMSALIPIKNDPVANDKALAGVRSDKARDAGDGYDGGWVAHPGLVPVAMEEWVKVLGDRPNQIADRAERVQFSRGKADLPRFLARHDDFDLLERIPALDILGIEVGSQREIVAQEHIVEDRSQRWINFGFGRHWVTPRSHG